MWLTTSSMEDGTVIVELDTWAVVRLVQRWVLPCRLHEASKDLLAFDYWHLCPTRTADLGMWLSSGTLAACAVIVLGLLAVFHTDCYTPHGGTRAAKKDFPNGDIVLVISFAYSIDVSCGKKDYTITMQGRPTRWTHEEKSLLTTISFRTDLVTLVANPQAMKHIQEWFA